MQSLQRALPEKQQQQQQEAQEATSSRTADDEATMSAAASASETLDMQNNAAMALPSQQAKVELDMEEIEEAEEEEEESDSESESESDGSDSESSDDEDEESDDEEEEEEDEDEEDEDATAAPIAPSTMRTGISPASSPTMLQASFFSAAATPTATVARNGPPATIVDSSSNVRRMRHRRGVTPALRHRRRQLLKFAAGPAQFDPQLTETGLLLSPAASEAVPASASAPASNIAFEPPVPFAAPSASPLLLKRHNKRQSFPIAGVSTNLVANDTIEVSGLGKDPDAEPFQIDQQCTDALAMPLLAIEHQGVQALALPAFDFWLFLLALFGVYHQSVPHVLATWVSKAAAVGWSGFQVASIKNFHQTFTEKVTEGACAGASGEWSAKGSELCPPIADRSFHACRTIGARSVL